MTNAYCSYVVYGIIICCLISVQAEYFCNDQYIESKDDITVRCFYVSQTPVTWHEAWRFCHKRRGWLANSPSRPNPQENIIGSELLLNNDVAAIWSGLHIQDHILLKDNFPIPVFEVEGNVQIDFDRISTSNQCVIEEFDNRSCLEQPPSDEFSGDIPQRRRRSIPEQCIESGSYLKRFISCDEKKVFGCHFSGNNLSNLSEFQYVGENEVAMYDEYFLPVQIYLTSEKTSRNDSDKACGRLLEGGTTFRETRRNPIDSLDLVVQAFKLEQKHPEYFKRQLHWVDRNDERCYAAGLSQAYSQQNNHQYSLMSWPCSSTIPAVCQRERAFTETTAILNADFRDVRLKQIGDEIEGISRDLADHLTFPNEEEELGRIYLTLVCVIPDFRSRKGIDSANISRFQTLQVLDPQQEVILYRSGIPSDLEADTIDSTSFRFSPATDSSNRDRIDILLILDSYQCVVNNKEDNKLISSNQIFLKPTDVEVYSFHIEILPIVTDSWRWSYYAASILNRLRTDRFEEPIFENPEEANLAEEGGIIERLRNIGIDWETRALIYIPRNGEDKNDKLVFYLYSRQKRRQKRELEEPEEPFDRPDEKKLLSRLQDQIRADLSENSQTYRPANTSSVRLFSIYWCWATTVFDNATNRNYSLPQSRGGHIYKSPQTCARDGKPLVTVECKGDRLIGFDWGPLEVNHLCDYSGSDANATDITNILQTLSQDDINATNVDTYLNKTKELTSVLKDDTVNTKDILYVADIIQKSTDIDNLSPEAAQDIMDTVNILSGLKNTTLNEAQDIGKASSRILQSVDKLGGQINIGEKANFQRIISGQYGLEVWNLTDGYKDSPIVGLKLLSSGGSELLTNDDMVSLFSENAVEYGKTEAAILLPKNFIMSVLGNFSSDIIKLSMNIYRDTSLYNAVGTNPNQTLNSKVIAAQLLLQGEAITDLSPYKVITIFQPKITLTDEERSKRSVCAYWDFEAKSGAGGWATDGCVYDKTEAGRDVCICDHLTNFAVLMNFYGDGQDADEHVLAMSIITIVGLSLSIFGLSISILSFLCIKKLRQGRPQQTLFNLALALLMSWIVFLVGIERTESHSGCIAVAAILHYLILASFMWMLMEGILQYLLFVRVMNTYFSKYMWKTGIPAWGLPLIPVIIVFAIDPELYRGRDDFCWMSLDAFYYAFALPVGLIVFANLVIFILVVISLCRRKDMGKVSSQSQSQTVVNIRASFICFFVLGISWIFGFLTIEEARTVFQYIFCISSTMQGFIIFLMMTARDKTIQQFWKKFCCSCCNSRDKGSAYRSSNDKGTGHTSQSSQAIPRLQKDKSGAYHGSSNSQVTSTTNLSITEADNRVSKGNRSTELECDYESFAT